MTEQFTEVLSGKGLTQKTTRNYKWRRIEFLSKNLLLPATILLINYNLNRRSREWQGVFFRKYQISNRCIFRGISED